MTTIPTKMTDARQVSEKLNHVFRHAYGQIVSVLTHRFGVHQMQLAEDVVQEAMADALEQWTYAGIPDNPEGWIYKVARLKALNVLKRKQYSKQYENAVLHEGNSKSDIPEIFSENEIADDQLRMIFTCCHPDISRDSQVALTLKTLCGFSISEIAGAFVTQKENINKRLVRARKDLQSSNIAFEVPTGEVLDKRLEVVLEVIYLLFNEGYQATEGPSPIRYELCEEAIRLATLLHDHPSIANQPRVAALLSLMYLNGARFSARMDADENLIELKDQDRSLWNQALINQGIHYLNLTLENKRPGMYQILATISAYHCTAPSYEETNWYEILKLYSHLEMLNPSPVVRLNKAVVVSILESPEKGIELINGLEGDKAMKKYLPFYLVKAELLGQMGQTTEALKIYERALELSPNEKLAREIQKKMALMKIS